MATVTVGSSAPPAGDMDIVQCMEACPILDVRGYNTGSTSLFLLNCYVTSSHFFLSLSVVLLLCSALS